MPSKTFFYYIFSLTFLFGYSLEAILTRNMYNLKLQIKDMPKVWHQYTKYILYNNLQKQSNFQTLQDLTSYKQFVWNLYVTFTIFEKFLKSINWKNKQWTKTSEQYGTRAWLTTTYPAGFILIQTGFKLAKYNIFSA